MTLTLPGIESLSLSVNEEIRVRASLDATFTALLEQLGPYNEMPDGTPMPMKLEPWPGGRSEEHTSELQSHHDLVCRRLLEKKTIAVCHNCHELCRWMSIDILSSAS